MAEGNGRRPFDDEPDFTPRDPLPLRQLFVPAPETIPPRPWLYGYWALRQAVTMIAAPGGTGKTALATAMILACATGRDLLGDVPHRPMTVAYLGLEETRAEAERRFASAMKFHDVDAEEFEGRIFYLDGKQYGFCAAQPDYSGVVQKTPDMPALQTELMTIGADLLFIDPMALAHTAPENDNNAMARVIGFFNEIAAACNLGVVIVHHTRKGAVAGDPDSIRGAGAIINHARIAIGLAPMSDEDRTLFGLDKVDQRRMVRIDDLKRNYSPRATEARWFKLESVSLGNGNSEYPHGDSVQVPRNWIPPVPDSIMSDYVRTEILDALDQGIPVTGGVERYSAAGSKRGAYQVVQIVLRRHGVSIPDQQARNFIRDWLAATPAVIEEKSYWSETRREQVTGVFVCKKAARDYADAD